MRCYNTIAQLIRKNKEKYHAEINLRFMVHVHDRITAHHFAKYFIPLYQEHPTLTIIIV